VPTFFPGQSCTPAALMRKPPFWKVPVSLSTKEFSGARLASERPARPGGLRGFFGFSAFG